MNYKFICTVHENRIYTAVLDKEDQLVEIHPDIMDTGSLIGKIVIGRVSNIVKGLNVAFINIGGDKDAFLQLEKDQSFLYTNGKKYNEPLRISDELLVQVTRDEQGSKAPSCSARISLTGRYLVLTYDKNFIGMSSKITDIKERKRLKQLMKDAADDSFGFIIRTNAEQVSDEDLLKEKDALIEEFHQLMMIKDYRKLFECIHRPPKEYIRIIRDLYKSEINSYLFDSEEIMEEALEFFRGDQDSIIHQFSLNQHNGYSLYKQYGLDEKIKKALNEKVWLKSGANLVIQKTEALTVIDVNSSKVAAKGNVEDLILSINMEAAKEAARQIRLRNLSGIILIDFIDMEWDLSKNTLLAYLEELLKRDRIKTTLVDMTPLGLVEITRKKITNPLQERLHIFSCDLNL